MSVFDWQYKYDYGCVTIGKQVPNMETEISKSKFKAHALEIFRHVETTGEEVIVTDHGVPAVVVRKYVGAVDDVRVRLKGSVLRYDAPFDPVADGDWDAMA